MKSKKGSIWVSKMSSMHGGDEFGKLLPYELVTNKRKLYFVVRKGGESIQEVEIDTQSQLWRNGGYQYYALRGTEVAEAGVAVEVNWVMNILRVTGQLVSKDGHPLPYLHNIVLALFVPTKRHQDKKIELRRIGPVGPDGIAGVLEPTDRDSSSIGITKPGVRENGRPLEAWEFQMDLRIHPDLRFPIYLVAFNVNGEGNKVPYGVLLRPGRKMLRYHFTAFGI